MEVSNVEIASLMCFLLLIYIIQSSVLPVSPGTLRIISGQLHVGRAGIPITWAILKQSRRNPAKTAYWWEQLLFGRLEHSLLLQVFYLLVFYFNKAIAIWEVNAT